MRTNNEQREWLIRALHTAAAYAHPIEAIKVIETHISWVVLTGPYAYKIKKPVKLPFVDFSTLARRLDFCKQELRLNRRLAPNLYLGIVPIGGSIDRPRLGQEPAIEYAVQMRQFATESRLDQQLARGSLNLTDMSTLAEFMARFHATLDPCAPDDTFASAELVKRTVFGNLDELDKLLESPKHGIQLSALRDWTENRYAKLETAFFARKSQGLVRECHGDLHLENLVRHGGTIVPFDALEFDPALRWIDIIDEIGFLHMDLIAHERNDLAYQFTNRYLEIGGDYAGLEVLDFYLVYRALVRAKVAAIRGAQQDSAGSDPSIPYLRLAEKLIGESSPLLIITHGLSGSGKTTVSDNLVPAVPVIRLRSDIERKRAHGFGPGDSSDSGIDSGLYAPELSAQTYDILQRHAATGLSSGFDILIDAAFLRRSQRDHFRRLAARSNARFIILDCQTDRATLRQRIESRAAAGNQESEATLEVLERQFRRREALSATEGEILCINTGREIDYADLAARIRRAP